MPGAFMRQTYVAPAATGFNLQDIDTAADGSWVPCDDYNTVTLYCFHDYAAATGVELYIEVKDDRDVASYLTVATDGGGGVYTLDEWKMQITTGADTEWECMVRNINARYLRVADALGQGSPSGDKLTISMLLAYIGA